MKRFKWSLFIIIIKTRLRSLKILNIMIILNILTFNIIKCIIKLLMTMSICNTFSSINKSLMILLKKFIRINSNYFASSLSLNHTYKINKIWLGVLAVTCAPLVRPYIDRSFFRSTLRAIQLSVLLHILTTSFKNEWIIRSRSYENFFFSLILTL